MSAVMSRGTAIRDESDTAGQLYYEYHWLPARSIRLIRILPSTSPRSLLEVEIRDFSLDEEIHFDALSYTWGPSTLAEAKAEAAQQFTVVPRCYPVLANGRLLLITRSLRTVLLTLRTLQVTMTREVLQRHPGGAVEYLWADGICIDQSSIGDKNTQIPLMAEIYTRARATFAWLGDEDEHSNAASATHSKLYKYALESVRRFKKRNELDQECFPTFESFGLSSMDWYNWAMFFTRAWFWRTWIVQEIALSGEDKIITMYGSSLTPMKIFREICMFIEGAKWGPMIAVKVMGYLQTHFVGEAYKEHNKPLEWLHGTHPLWTMYPVWEMLKEGNKPSFYFCSRVIFEGTKCSDPRDKIFGKMAIAADLDPVDDSFRADYSLTKQVVYTQATSTIVIKNGNLDLLSLVAHHARAETQKESQQLPSWCPDYNDFDRPITPLELDHFNASRSSRTGRNTRESEGCELPVKGFRCDIVNGRAAVHKWLQDLETFAGPIDLAFDLNEDAISSRSNLLEKLWRTLICDNCSTDGSPGCVPAVPSTSDFFHDAMLLLLARCFADDKGNYRHGSDHAEVLPRLLEKFEALAKSKEDKSNMDPAGFLSTFNKVGRSLVRLRETHENGANQNIRHLFAGVHRTSGADQLLNFDHRLCVTICHGRCLFRTCGKRLGLGHLQVDVDDEFWLLAGGKTPYILRPKSTGRYQYIGDAYIQGVMLGELWPENQNDLTEIVLV